MISGKQLKQILDYSFTAGTSFLAPTATFLATPSTYTSLALPASVVLSGAIIPNSGTSISWTITNAAAATLAFGSGNAPTHTLAVVPSAVASSIYNLNITYTNTITGTTQSIITPTVVSVTSAALKGQIDSPTQTITIPGDLTPYLADLTITDQAELINVFDVVATDIGRIVFAIPDDYGIVSIIEDGSGLNVLDQFTPVIDTSNARTIFTSIDVVTPATYNYKLVF